MGYEGDMKQLDVENIAGFLGGLGTYGGNGVGFGQMRQSVAAEECIGSMKGLGTYGGNGVGMGEMRTAIPIEDTYGFMGVHHPVSDLPVQTHSGNMRFIVLAGRAPTDGDNMVELSYDFFLADFSFSQVSPGSLMVGFTDESNDDPVSWVWRFGDGRGSAAQNPYHLFLLKTPYVVHLLATNKNGNASEASKIVDLSEASGSKATVNSSVMVVHSSKKAFVLGGISSSESDVVRFVAEFLKRGTFEDTF